MRRDQRPPALPPGEKIDDFEIVRLLGRGAFGHVYLARQLSLDRLVALKVSANRGSEGRTMARLEHAHIVQVYSEKVDEATDQRLLCMQLVPGVGLEKIIGSIGMQLEVERSLADTLAGAASAPATWRGSDVLAVIDANASLPTALDPAALRDREAMGEMDAIETTAWMGARLGEALDFAHQRGVLHRDIKPANILVSPYGRPMLADFNISSQQTPKQGEMFGGTVAYMAPEHLDAFNPADDTTEASVTEQADIYSLGIVLDELLQGKAATLDRSADRPGRPAPQAGGLSASEAALLAGRHARCPQDARTDHLPLPGRLPGERFNSGGELAEQLEGCRQLRQAERALPPATGIVPSIIARPFLWFVLLVLLPQILASAINISYNASQIVWHLTAPQQQMFMQLVTILQPGDLSRGIRAVRLGVCSCEADVARDARHMPLAPGRVDAPASRRCGCRSGLPGSRQPAGCPVAYSFRR